MDTLKTEDGYTLHIQPDGRVTDHSNPELADLSWDSVDDCVRETGAVRMSLTADFLDAITERHCTDFQLSWQGQTTTSATDKIEVTHPVTGAIQTTITVPCDAGRTVVSIRAEIAAALQTVVFREESVVLTDREQDRIFSDIPRGYYAADPEEQCAADHCCIYATPNGCDEIVAITVVKSVDDTLLVDITIQIGLVIIVEPEGGSK
jgi:hypothetical protein